MTLVPQNTRFIGFSEIANLAERKTDYLNSISQPFTMQDITDSVGGFSKNGAIINTVTDVFSTTFENNITVDPFYSIDTDLYNAAILEYTMFSEIYTYTGSAYFYKYKSENTFIITDPGSNSIEINQGEPVGSIIPIKLSGFYGDIPNNTPVQIIYTFKLYRVPLYYTN